MKLVSLRFKFLKIFKGVPKNNPRTHLSQQIKKKNRVDDSCLFQSLYSRKVKETIIAVLFPSFTKKDASSIKQKK